MPGPNDPRPARKLPDLGKQRRVPVEPQQPEEPQAEAPKKRRANLGEEVRVAAKRKRPIDIPVERPVDAPVRRPVDHPVDVHPQRPDRPVEVPVQRFDAGQIAQLQIDRRVPTVVIDPGLVIPPIKIPRVPEGSSQAAPAPEVTLDHHVEVIRSADLVSMVVSTSGFDLADGVFTTAADGPGGLLVFTLPFQHLGEQAFYEGIPAPQPNPADPDGPPVQSSGGPEQPTNPVGGIPARATRVVLQVPAGESVEVGTSALLAALEKYPMAVHPLATPGAPYRRNPFNPRLVQVLANAGLIQHVLAADEQPAFTDLHAADTTAGIAQRARALAQVRATLNAPAAHAAVTELVDDWRIPVTKMPPIFRNPEKLSRPPGTGETAIEAPYRLVVSPSTQSGWTHADDPVPDTSGTAVELWHTRLGHRDADGTVTEAEQTIRAVWARDRERFDNWPGTDFPPETPEVPMRMSLNSSDRHMLVRQSSEVWAKNRTKIADPTPVEADRLYLSSLGAWLDLHGEWDTLPWSTATLSSIMSWDHEAPMGRDQYVRVVYPGYLFPFGHKATLVKVTERKIKSKTDPKATLFQRKFIVVGEPVKTYTDIGNPFKRVEIAPTITPILSPEPTAAQEQSFFVVQCGGGPFQFVLHCIDADDREVKLPTPLVWVAEKYALPNPAGNAATPIKAFADLGPINGLGQNVSFAPSEPGGVDLAVPTVALTFSGTIPSVGKAVPQFVSAKATIPAVERMKPTGPQEFTYADAWLQHGFGAGNEGQVWAELTSPTTLGFGSGGASSGGAGGFIAPSLPIAALSRSQGPVGDAATVAAGDFDAGRVVEEGLGQFADVVGEGGREEQALLLLGHHREDLADVADEAHVEHAIGFVEDENLDCREIDGTLLHVVEQAPRGRDQNVDAPREGVNLRVDTDATEDRERGERQVLAVGAHAFLDLHGEFARRRQHQHARLLRPRALALQQLQDGQREAGGLAGAGLRAGHQVALLQHDGNRLLLDRGRGVIALLGNGAQDLGREAQVGKFHGDAPERWRTAPRPWRISRNREKVGEVTTRVGEAMPRLTGCMGELLDEGAQSSTRHSCHEEINISYRLFASANFRG